MSDKPREWHLVMLYIPEDREDVIAGEVHNQPIHGVEYTPVIEKSAYDALVEENERLKSLVSVLKDSNQNLIAEMNSDELVAAKRERDHLKEDIIPAYEAMLGVLRKTIERAKKEIGE